LWPFFNSSRDCFCFVFLWCLNHILRGQWAKNDTGEPISVFFLKSLMVLCQLKKLHCLHGWLTPVILTTQEAEIRRITIWSQPRQTVPETLSQKTLSQKIGLVVWLKVKALSSNLSTEGGKKKSCISSSIPQKPEFMIVIFFLFCFSWDVGIKPRTLHMLGKHSTTELHSQSLG
jgi:hypothetical protein